MTTSWCSGRDPRLLEVMHGSALDSHELVKNDSHVRPDKKKMSCCDMSHTCVWIASQFSYWQACVFATVFPGWICQWKPCWILVGDSFQKAYLEEWIHMGDDSTSNLGEQCMANIPTMVQGAEYKDCTTKQKRPEEAPPAPRSSWQGGGEHDTPTWKLSGTQGTASFSERTGAPLPPLGPRCKFITPEAARSLL